MYNTKTKNKSFINMWRILQDSNVENNIFMLELKDESLLDFSIEDLNNVEDRDKKSILLNKIIEECRNNIWFFFREVIRLPNIISTNYNYIDNCPRFVLTPESLAMIYLYNNHKSFIKMHKDLKGDTTTLILLYMYEILINDNFNEDDLIVLISNKHDNPKYSTFCKYRENYINANSALFINFQYNLLYNKKDDENSFLTLNNDYDNIDEIYLHKDKLFIDVCYNHKLLHLLNLVNNQINEKTEFYAVTESNVHYDYLLSNESLSNEILIDRLFTKVSLIKSLELFDNKFDYSKPLLLDF